MRRFAWFCLAGGVAFLVDAGVVLLMVNQWGIDAYVARIVSFAGAVTTTWQLNRMLAFRGHRALSLWQEWRRYVASQMGGLVINYGVYAAMVWSIPMVARWPVIGVAAGSAAGLVANYTLAKKFVFRQA